jgi:hypothetical protein
VVEPFVTGSRNVAAKRGLVDASDRFGVFVETLRDPDVWMTTEARELNVESPFRGIYLAADQTVRMSQLYDGPWDGVTLTEGLRALVPRVLMPGKPEMNMGNFFAHELGIAVGFQALTNICITLPFEFVGNFGYVSGVLAFALIGVVWAAFAVSLLTGKRLETHPLVPFFVLTTFNIQASLSQYLVTFRDLPLVTLGAFLVWRFSKRRL